MDGGTSLFWNKNTTYVECIYDTVSKTGKTVLLLTHTPSPSELLPRLIDELSFPKELLKHFIVMTFLTIEDLTLKLLELHDWMTLPALLIVDLVPFIASSSDQQRMRHDDPLNDYLPPPLLKSICFCIASQQSYLDSVRRRLKKKDGIGTGSTSLLVLQENAENLTQTQMELIVNLYFNTHNVYDQFAELQSVILQRN